MKKALAILFLLFSFHLGADPTSKLYLSPQHVAIDATGISVYHDGCIFTVPTIYSDTQGIYVIPPLQSWCERGHSTICFFCEGCDVWYCPKRCRCPD